MRNDDSGPGDRIEFISSYCDGWCERCPFTSRCSAYAVRIAAGMCDGDLEAAFELAIGPPPPETAREAVDRQAFLEEMLQAQPDEEEIERCSRDLQVRAERIDESPVTTRARKVMTLATGWLRARGPQLPDIADPALQNAIAVAAWDAHLIGAKLHRALGGRDDHLRDRDMDDDPVQNDWNGSAKVALISIARSLTAWETIATSLRDADAHVVADQLRRLRDEVERMFPDAWRFKRPGFDDGALTGREP